MGNKDRLEKARKCVDTVVKDEALREHLQEVVSGLDILVSCIEPEEFAGYIKKCVECGNSIPIKKPLKEILFGHSYTIEEEEERDDYELVL